MLVNAAGNWFRLKIRWVSQTLCSMGVPDPLFWRPQLRDPADEMMLETALNGRADALVTFNVNDFAPARRFALPVINPSTFLQQLLKEKS